MKSLVWLLALVVFCSAALAASTTTDEQTLVGLARLRDQRVAAGDQGALQAGIQFVDVSAAAFGSVDLRTADGSVRVAMILDMLGKLEEAVARYRPACAVFVSKSPVSDERPGLCLHALAMTLIRQGQTVEARPICQDAVARLRVTLAPSRLGAAIFALAEQLNKSGDKSEASKYFVQAGETLSALSQTDRSYAVTAFAEAARIAGERGDRPAVRDALERAVTIGQEAGPGERARAVSLKYELADTLTSLGEFDHALQLLSEVRSALAAVKSEGHAEPEALLPRVAGLQLRNGSIDQAIPTVGEAMRVSGLPSFGAGAQEARIGLALKFVDAAEFIKDYRQSRRLIDALLAEEDRFYASWQAGHTTAKEFAQWFTVISNRISTYQMNRGEFPEARRVLEKARTRAREVLGERNELEVAVLARLGALTIAQQDPASALEYLEEAVKTATGRGAIDKEYELLSELAMAQKRMGYSDLSKQTEEKSLVLKERYEGITPSLLSRRAWVLHDEGGVDNLRAARIFAELAMLADPSSTTIASQLASIYEDEGSLDKAIDTAAEALKLRLQKFGPEHINTASSHYDLGRLYLKANNKANARRSFVDAATIFSARVNDLEDQLSLSELRLTLPSLVDSWRSALMETGTVDEDATVTFDLVAPWKGRVEEILRRQALWSIASASPEAKTLSSHLEAPCVNIT